MKGRHPNAGIGRSPSYYGPFIKFMGIEPPNHQKKKGDVPISRAYEAATTIRRADHGWPVRSSLSSLGCASVWELVGSGGLDGGKIMVNPWEILGILMGIFEGSLEEHHDFFCFP